MAFRLQKLLTGTAVLAALGLVQPGWAQPGNDTDQHAGHGQAEDSSAVVPDSTSPDGTMPQHQGDGQGTRMQQRQGNGQGSMMQQRQGDGQSQGGMMQQRQGDSQGDMMQRMMRMRERMGVGAQSSAAGQDAFSALRSVVQQLESNPDTDWSRINIDALRDHLVDMQEVTINAAVSTERVENGAVYRVTGQARTLEAIRRMVPAHAAQITDETDWTATTRDLDDGVEVTLTASTADQVARIHALGFFGFMVSGEHHDNHHLAIAGADTETMVGSHRGNGAGHQGNGGGRQGNAGGHQGSGGSQGDAGQGAAADSGGNGHNH